MSLTFTVLLSAFIAASFTIKTISAPEHPTTLGTIFFMSSDLSSGILRLATFKIL
jgi:hypothetical protein